MLPRRKRRVRLHFLNDAAPSIEGFFTGLWANHYVLDVAEVIPKPGERVPIGKARVNKHLAWMEDL